MNNCILRFLMTYFFVCYELCMKHCRGQWTSRNVCIIQCCCKYCHIFLCLPDCSVMSTMDPLLWITLLFMHKFLPLLLAHWRDIRQTCEPAAFLLSISNRNLAALNGYQKEGDTFNQCTSMVLHHIFARSKSKATQNTGAWHTNKRDGPPSVMTWWR